MVVASPAPRRVVALARARVQLARRCFRDAGQVHHLPWHIAIGRATAELAVAVGAPSPDRAVGLHRAAVIPTRRDRDRTGEAHDLHRAGPGRRGHVAELPRRVASPTPYGTVR